MGRSFACAAIAFVAGIGVGFLAARRIPAAGAGNGQGNAADLAAIERLHRADVDATMTQDLSALTALWSEDAINLGFAGPPIVGVPAMREAYRKMQADYPQFKVLKYAPSLKNLQVVDDWALEVMTGESTFRLTANTAPVTVSGETMRLLKRQSDGTWKFALVGMK